MRLLYLSLQAADAWIFEPALLRQIRQQFPDWVTFELDQASDEQNLTYALQLTEEPYVLIVEAADKKLPPAAIGKLLNRLLQQKRRPLKAILYGRHPMLARMLQRLAKEDFSTVQEEKEAISFLQ